MKYKAGKLNNGKWAVMTGKKYFTSTVCETENEAIIKACEKSAQWYMQQMHECEKCGKKLTELWAKLIIILMKEQLKIL